MATITNIAVPGKEQVDATSQAIFEQLNAQLGMVPNIYATIGYSSNALSSFLAFSGNAGKDTFNKKEIEAIKLAVSEANNCAYCKSAHTALAKMNGFSDEETLQIRNGGLENEKLNVLTTLAREVASKAGNVDEGIREQFFAQGYDEKALIDFVAVVVSVTFTNYVFALTKVPIDFPAVN